MTLRETLQSVNLEEVYRLINEKDQDYIAECDRPSMEETRNSYSKVVEELLSKPSVPPADKIQWLVHEEKDWYDGHIYINVCFLNLNYEAPAEGLKPWGGDGETPVPEGCFDCNADKHNEKFAVGFSSWSETIDTPVIIKVACSLEKAVAELLWELTFYGWSEAKQAEFKVELERRLDEAKQDIDEGKYIEISPKTKDGYKVIIPDCVSKDIADICNEASDNQINPTNET